MSGPICEECKRLTWVLFQCDICHRQVCGTCLRTSSSTFAKSVQICRRCEQSPPKVTPVKALSGYAEYFWLMAMNWKDIENRNWSQNTSGAMSFLSGFIFMLVRHLPLRMI